MTVDTRVVTADELLRLPDDGVRYELVEGELRKTSPAGTKHGAITNRISVRLGAYAEQHRLGQVYSSETGFLLSRNPDTVLQPDVGYVHRERVVENDAFFPGAPDVAFEVISPSDRYTEVEEKKDRYLGAGPRSWWLSIRADARSRCIAPPASPMSPTPSPSTTSSPAGR